MAVPVFQNAGAGAAINTSGNALSVPLPTSIVSGDLLIAHVMWRNTADAPTTPSGWTLQYGPDGTSILRSWTFFRVADGTESGNVGFGTAGGTLVRAGRIYRFNGTASSSIFEAAGFAQLASATISDVGVITTGVDRLAVNLVAVSDANAVGSFTGETGGNWAEAVAEFTTLLGANACLQLQIANMDSAGTINGGTFVMAASDTWNVRGFAILPGALSVSPASIAPTLAFGAPKLNLKVSPTGVASTLVFGVPKLNLKASPASISSTLAFGTTTFAFGGVTVSPAGKATTLAFGTPIVSVQGIISPAGKASSLVFGVPSFVLGGVTRTPTSITSTLAIGTPTLVPGGVTRTISGIASTLVLGVPAFVLGGVTTSPAGISSTLAFGVTSMNIETRLAALEVLTLAISTRLELYLATAPAHALRP